MQLKINNDKRELKEHGRYEFPVLVDAKWLSIYERGAFVWHWHPEVELTLILEGAISYQVNDKTYELHEGDALFCNANALHTGHMIDSCDCRYSSITFHPRMIYGYQGSVIQSGYVDPIIYDDGFGSVMLSEKVDWQRKAINAIRAIVELDGERAPAYEMRIQQALSVIWTEIYYHAQRHVRTLPDAANRDFERLRRILTYIQTHYMERITLEDIAAQINICKSECCRFFKRHMNQSLFDYLLYYRVEKSLSLLSDGECTVTEASDRTGFSSPSYFARVFKKQMGCPPSEYRSRKEGAR